MWRFYLLLCLIHSEDTEQASVGRIFSLLDDGSFESWNCTAINVEVSEGKTLNLIGSLDATGGRCSWIHNEECCYDDKKNGDCEYYKKSVTLTPNAVCLKDDDFEVKIDSYKNLTCTLVIKSFNEAAVGDYQSVSQHNAPLQMHCGRPLY